MKRILYLGLTLPHRPLEGEIFHYPIIQIVPRLDNDPAILKALLNFDSYTHLVITSKTAIPLLFKFAKSFGIPEKTIQDKKVFTVGKASAATASKYGMSATFPVAEESAEGMVAILKDQNLQEAYLFWPHSALSRSILPDFFQYEGIKFCDTIFYDTIPNRLPFPPEIDLSTFDEIVFTSPSTVDAFCEILGPIPWHKQITSIGSVTAAYLEKLGSELPIEFSQHISCIRYPE